MAVTQRQIAELANVSVNTVSLVLRHVPDLIVSDATRQRILDIAEELGYRPNPHARALVGGKAPLIKIVCRPWDLYISNMKAATLLTALSDLGRNLSVSDVVRQDDPQDAADALLWGSPEAVVFPWLTLPVDFVAPVCQALHDEGVHVVIADCSELPPPDVPCDAASLDRLGGATLALSYLIELGHRRIGLVTGPGYDDRRQAYELVLAQHDITERFIGESEPAPSLGDSERQAALALGGAQATERLLKDNPSVTALMCSSDMTALGAMHAVHRLGLRVPEDVALIGLHNEPWTQFLPVPLSTMAEPVHEMCELSRRFLGQRLDGDTQPWQRAKLSYELIVRESSGPPPGRAASIKATSARP